MGFRRSGVRGSTVLWIVLPLLLLGGCTLPLVWESPAPTESPEAPDFPDLTISVPDETTSPEPSQTPIPTEALTETPPPEVLSPTPTHRPYILQPGSPGEGLNFAHPQSGCNWFGVAGQVLDTQRDPVEGLLIEVRGSLGAAAVQALALTGTAQAYGPGGYEIVLGDRPIASQDSLSIQVFDTTGAEKSEIYHFSTSGGCETNLVLINFVEVPGYDHQWYLPLVFE